MAMCCDVDLKWLPFCKQALISKCIIAYKRLRGEMISYLNDLLKLKSNVQIRHTNRLCTVPYFPCDRRYGSLSSMGRYLGPLMRVKLGRVQNAPTNPTTPTQGHFVLSPVSLASRDQGGGPVELNDRHLRSHWKIGGCEQSSTLGILMLFQFPQNVTARPKVEELLPTRHVKSGTAYICLE